MLNWLKDKGFEPVDPDLFEELIESHTLAMVRSTSLAASSSSFFKAKRREAYLSHFPSHIGKHFKKELSASAFKSTNLFHDDVLASVSSLSQADSTLNAQLSIAIAVTFPVFGAGKGNRKASSDSSSAAAPSAPPPRGRGRGNFSWRGVGQRRKADFKDGNPKGAKAPKSPHKSPKSPRGRGFRK